MTKAPPSQQLLDRIAVSTEEGAQLFGISERFFQDLRRRPGFPPARQLGRAVRWSPQELMEWFHSLPAADIRPEPEQLRFRRYRDGQLVSDGAELKSARLINDATKNHRFVRKESRSASLPIASDEASQTLQAGRLP